MSRFHAIGRLAVVVAGLAGALPASCAGVLPGGSAHGGCATGTGTKAGSATAGCKHLPPRRLGSGCMSSIGLSELTTAVGGFA